MEIGGIRGSMLARAFHQLDFFPGPVLGLKLSAAMAGISLRVHVTM